MTAIDSESGIDVEELVGGIDEVPCEYSHSADVPPAAVYCVPLCCTRFPPEAICEGHHAGLLGRWLRAPYVTCTECGATVQGGGYRAIRKFVPIERGGGSNG